MSFIILAGIAFFLAAFFSGYNEAGAILLGFVILWQYAANATSHSILRKEIQALRKRVTQERDT